MGLGRRVYGLVMVSLLLMAIVEMCCAEATIEEEAAKDESWTGWAKEKIGLQHEDKDAKDAAKRKAEETVGTAKEKTEGAYETAKSKAGETVGTAKEKASQSYDTAGQVKDDVFHKAKTVKDSFSGDSNDESWSEWAKETIGIKNEDTAGETVTEKAKDAKEAAKSKAEEAKERLEETAEAAKEKAKKLKEEAERESKNTKEKTKESYESAKEKADEKSEEAKESVSHKSKRVQDSFTDDNDEL